MTKSYLRFVLKSDRPPIQASLRQDSRYKNGTTIKMRLSVSSCSLQGVAERPLPCNYNVIQPVSALSRRKRGFKSRRGRQFNTLQEKCLLSV